MVPLILARYRAAYTGLSAEVWVIAIALFINRCGTMVLPFMALYLTKEIGISESSAGRLISVYGLGAIAGSYLGGRLTKRSGAIRIQTLALFLSVPVFLVVPLGKSWGQIAAAIFCLSLVSEAVRPASATAVAHYSQPENRMRAFALQRLAANLGFSFGPAIGGVLANINYVLLFVVDALTTLAAACLMLGYFKMTRTSQENDDRSDANTERSPLVDTGFLAFLGLVLLTNLVFFQFHSTYPLYLRDHFTLSEPQIGLMFAVNTGVIVVFEMLLIDCARRWRLLPTIGWGSLLICLGFAMLPFGTTGAYCVLCMVVLTIGEMLSFPLANGYVANRGEHGNQAMYLSWYMITFSIAAVLGPAVGASVYEIHDELIWYLSFAAGAVVIAGFYGLELGLSDKPDSS